jgi:hypothetical protein
LSGLNLDDPLLSADFSRFESARDVLVIVNLGQQFPGFVTDPVFSESRMLTGFADLEKIMHFMMMKREPMSLVSITVTGV